MSDADVAETLKLPVEERVRLLELIWESLASNPAALPLGDAHQAPLDERLAEHERNPDNIATRGEVLAESRRGCWRCQRSAVGRSDGTWMAPMDGTKSSC